MGFSWTPKQQQVIKSRNRNILVSAAAGSGKTAVLVQRILELVLDEEEGCNIDEFVIVTFTKAAAAEMKQRIIVAFEDLLEAKQGDSYIEKQLVLIHQAQITTIHGFCKQVIEQNFFRLDLEPGFRIGDEGEISLIKKDVLDQILTQQYEEGEETFFDYINHYAPRKNDLEIENQILKLYETAMGNPWPEKFLQLSSEKYLIPIGEEDNFYLKEVVQIVQMEMSSCKNALLGCLKIIEEDESLLAYQKNLESDISQLELILQASDYNSLAKGCRSYSPTRLASVKNCEDEDRKEFVKETRTAIKGEIKGLIEKFFFASPLILEEGIAKSGQMVLVLIQLTLAFKKQFQEEKKKRNILDFSDLEHMALSILVDKATQEPTETALEYQRKYHHIMIDEYQDSNLVQEILMTSIAGRGKGEFNIFMVGDVKQSIYRFRLARPELFMEKYDHYQENGKTKEKINLHQNFRSRREVLDVVNDLFSKIMKRDLGGVDYDEDASLVFGASYPQAENQNQFQAELLIVDQDIELPMLDSAEKEGVVIAKLIVEILEKGEVTDKKTGQLRKARYSDIVILSRSVANWAQPVKNTLELYGIPVYTTSTTGYFAALEIKTILAMLHLVDNLNQDIPLVTVMTSAMFDFSTQELAVMKTSVSGKFFHQVVQNCRMDGNLIPEGLRSKLNSFFEVIQNFRKASTYLSIHELIQLILSETMYLEYVSVMPAGNVRKMNLMMLVEKAIQFEQTSYKGVFNFLRYMERLEKYEIDFGTAAVLGEGEDVVRIMSTHKSKGLEFPIVIVGNLGKGFSSADKKNSLMIHPENGIGLQDIDSEKRTKRESIPRNLIRNQMSNENLGEELRILYVALTRAKEKLYMVASIKKLDKTLGKLQRKLQFNDELMFHDRKNASNAFQWIYPVISNMEDKYIIRIEEPNPLALKEYIEDHTMEKEIEMQEKMNDRDTSVIKQLEKQFQYCYPFKEEGQVKTKMSVSEIKHRYMETNYLLQEDGIEIPNFMENELVEQSVIPGFLGGASTVNIGAAKGTAVHRFLESFDFASYRENLSIEEIISSQAMSYEQKKLLNVKQLNDFLRSKLAKRMVAAAMDGKLKKEKPFVMGISPKEAGLDNEIESVILVQGIIDVFFEEKGEIVLVDYKTDRVNTLEELINRYRKQMELYKMAIEKSTNKRVKEVILYSFSLQSQVEIL